MGEQERREKEIKRLLHLKKELIKQTYKEVKELRIELNEINGEKTLKRTMKKNETRRKRRK